MTSESHRVISLRESLLNGKLGVIEGGIFSNICRTRGVPLQADSVLTGSFLSFDWR